MTDDLLQALDAIRRLMERDGQFHGRPESLDDAIDELEPIVGAQAQERTQAGDASGPQTYAAMSGYVRLHVRLHTGEPGTQPNEITYTSYAPCAFCGRGGMLFATVDPLPWGGGG